MNSQISKAMILGFVLLTSLISAESKVVSNDKNEVSNGNGTVVVVNIRNSNKTQYHNQNFRQGNYNFGYDIKPDGPLGQFHHENKAEDGVVYGCYGYVDPLDKAQITYYVSDSWGYRALRQGQSIKVFYPRDHPEGATEMKGFELKWSQLQFPTQCDSLQENILTAHPSSQPILQAESAPVARQPSTSTQSPAPRPTRPTPSAAAPASKKNDQTPLSVMLTYGPTASLDGLSSSGNKDFPASPSKPVESAALVDTPTPTQSNERATGDGSGYGGPPGITDNVAVKGYGEAPENDAVTLEGNSPVDKVPQSARVGGSSGEQGPISDGYVKVTVTSSPERLSGNAGGSAERGVYAGHRNNAPTQQPAKVSEYNQPPANTVAPASNSVKQEGPFSRVEHKITASINPTPTPTSSSHRVPEISIHITQPNFEDGSKPYPQSGENDDDNYYAGGSNKNIIYPNSNEDRNVYNSQESDSKQGGIRTPDTDYRPPSPTINYVQQAPKYTDPLHQYPSNSGPQRDDANANRQQTPLGNSGTSGSGAPSASYGIRTPDGQSYPSTEQLPNRPGSYPSPTVSYEDRREPNTGGDGSNYNNRRDGPAQGSTPTQQTPSGNGNGGCNGGCNQQQQPPAQDPQFIDYSQFPGAVVSNVPVIFYPDCRSNAFTRPAVVPFCPSLQPSAQPSAVPACSHRQPLTMRFPSDQSNTLFTNNYDLPSTRGAYPSSNFVTVGNPPRAARRVVRRSRTHTRPVSSAKN